MTDIISSLKPGDYVTKTEQMYMKKTQWSHIKCKNHIIINFMHAPATMELKLRRYRNADVLHTNDVWDAFY